MKEHVTVYGDGMAGPHAGIVMAVSFPIWRNLRAAQAGKARGQAMRDILICLNEVADFLKARGAIYHAQAQCDEETNPPTILEAGKIGFTVIVQHSPCLAGFGGSFIASLTEDSRGLVLEYASYQTPIAQIGETDRRTP